MHVIIMSNIKTKILSCVFICPATVTEHQVLIEPTKLYDVDLENEKETGTPAFAC